MFKNRGQKSFLVELIEFKFNTSITVTYSMGWCNRTLIYAAKQLSRCLNQVCMNTLCMILYNINVRLYVISLTTARDFNFTKFSYLNVPFRFKQELSSKLHCNIDKKFDVCF